MQPADDFQEGAGLIQGMSRGEQMNEPLFGDRRWVEERLRVIREQGSGGDRAGGEED